MLVDQPWGHPRDSRLGKLLTLKLRILLMIWSTLKRAFLSFIGLGMIIMVGCAQRELQVNEEWSEYKNVCYNVFSRTAFPLGINIALIPALVGHG